jgi:hypothetical protein
LVVIGSFESLVDLVHAFSEAEDVIEHIVRQALLFGLALVAGDSHGFDRFLGQATKTQNVPTLALGVLDLIDEPMIGNHHSS